MAMLWALFAGAVIADHACQAVSSFNASRFPTDYLRPSEVKSCLSTITIDVAAAQDAITGALQMLDIYSYEHYQIQSHNNQLPAHVDIRKELASINLNSSFPDFSRSLFGAFNSLNDGHTELAIDCVNRVAFDAFLPLALIAPSSNTPAEVLIHPEYDQFLVDRKINDTAQFMVHKSLAGSKVLEIDGQDVMRYLQDLIHDRGILFGNIDPQTRFNQLFVNLRGQPTPRLGYGVALTSLSRNEVEHDTLRIKVLTNQKERVVEIPWYGLVDTDYHKVKERIAFEDYYRNYVCMRQNQSDLITGRYRDFSRPILYDQEYRSRDTMHFINGSIAPSMKTVSPASADIELVASVNSGFHMYHFLNTSIAVIQLTNFFDGTSNASRGYEAHFSRRWTSGLQQLLIRGVDTVIFDISGNNGGKIELGSLVMLSLFPNQYPGFPSQIRINNETFTFLNGSGLEQSFARLDGSRFANLTDWMYVDNSTMSINGVDSSYSQMIVDDLRNKTQWSVLANSSFPRDSLFKPEKMLIISNGKCASTCAQVAMYLQDVHGVKSVGFGGIPGSTELLQTVGGVRGAQVLEMLDPTDASGNMYNFSMRIDQMTVNFRSAIHHEKHVPTEFVTRNVDYSYQHTAQTYNSFENTWRFVAEKHFPDSMTSKPSRQVEWAPLDEYPAGWFDRVLAVQSALKL